MTLGPTRKRFDELLASTGAPLASLTPRSGLRLMMQLVDESSHNALLICHWGNVARYGPEVFGFSAAFHLSDSPDGDGSRFPEKDYSQLTLMFKVGPPPPDGVDHEGLKMYGREDPPSDFWSKLEATEAFRTWGDLPAVAVGLFDETVEDRSDDLVDCWGDRHPERPVVAMTEHEWLHSENAPLMVLWFFQEWAGTDADLKLLLRRYFLACCLRIRRLLPDSGSRFALELAERYLEGEATAKELGAGSYYAEGSAYLFDESYWDAGPKDCGPEILATFFAEKDDIIREVEAIPPGDLAVLVRLAEGVPAFSLRELLESAAWFLFSSLHYGGPGPTRNIEKYRHFFDAPLLRKVIGNPFR